MTNEMENNGHRHEDLERRVTVLESTVEAEATARASMDEDLTELKIKRNMLQKVLDTQSDHNRRLARIEGKVDNVELSIGHLNGRVGQLEGGMKTLNGRVGNLEGGMKTLNGRVGNLEGGVERLNGRMDQLENRVGGVEDRLGGVENTLSGVKGGVDEILARLGTPPGNEN